MPPTFGRVLLLNYRCNLSHAEFRPFRTITHQQLVHDAAWRSIRLTSIECGDSNDSVNFLLLGHTDSNRTRFAEHYFSEFESARYDSNYKPAGN